MVTISLPSAHLEAAEVREGVETLGQSLQKIVVESEAVVVQLYPMLRLSELREVILRRILAKSY